MRMLLPAKHEGLQHICPTELRSRLMQPVSFAHLFARSSKMNCDRSPTYDTLLIKAPFRHDSTFKICFYHVRSSLFVISFLKLVRIGEHKASPLPCYGFASRCVHGGKGTFLSLHPEISLSVSFANRVSTV